MPLTAIEGVVENGMIRLREDVALPENTRVYVIVADPQSARPFSIQSPRLAHPKDAGDFRKQIVEIAPDAPV
jgi:hypothetical protein